MLGVYAIASDLDGLEWPDLIEFFLLCFEFGSRGFVAKGG